jgi:hypothetical protein
MLKIGLAILVLTAITNNPFFNRSVIVSPQPNSIFSIENQSSNFFSYIACQNKFRVADRTASNLVKPGGKVEIPSEYLNSSTENKKITIYILSADYKGDSKLIQNQFDKSCEGGLSDITNTTIEISKNTSIALVVTGETTSNGMEKLIPSLNIDNTAHLVGTDVASFYKPNIQRENLFVPITTGIIYITSDEKMTELCLDKKLTNLELSTYTIDQKKIGLGFLPLNQGKYTIWPKSELGCDTIPETSEVVSIFQNQFAIVESTTTINQMYKATGLTVVNKVDKNVK